MAEADKSMEDISPPGEDEYFVEDKDTQTENEVEVISSAEIQQVTKSLSSLNTSEAMDTSEPNMIIIAHFSMPTAILDQKATGIKWISVPRTSIDAVTHKILEELKERNPQEAKCLTVCAYQQFLTTHDSATLEKHLVKITKAAVDSKIHKLSLATFIFVPEEERTWEKAAMLNQHLRLLNLDMGLEPNNVHKGLNFSFTKGKVVYIRYNLWKERMEGTGVGATLNTEGLKRYKIYLLKFIHGGGFTEKEGPVVRAVGGEGVPAPLCFTRGYKGNDKMLGFIKEKGLRLPAKPEGDNRTDAQKNREAIRARARQFGEESRAKYGEWKDETDRKTERKENGMRGRERLESRDKERRENKEHQLKQEVHKLKLESIKARNRSRVKYEEFERQITMLKDKVKQRERMLSELRRDLARAEVDAEEWRDVASRNRSYDKGPKRARRF